MGLDRFSNGEILTGCLSNIFGFSIFYMQERKYVGIVYILFLCHHGEYSLGLLHHENYSHGA